MWHEARKQERKIRGMLVDYRKRAERRRDFYEKIKADPTQFLQLHGRQCKIHLDPSVAAAADSPAAMMPWQGQTDNLIDRFDVRAHLDFIQPIKKQDDEEISSEERQLNYERYRIIAQNSFLGVSEEKFLKQLHLEEQFGYTESEPKKKKLVGAAIGFNYEDNTGTSQSTMQISNAQGNSSDENSDSDLDVDLSINVSKMDSAQAHEMNRHGRNFGMSSNDFYSFLTNDLEEAENFRLAKEEEHEKALFSGRKSRRERRAHREKRLANRVISPPSYAARTSPTYPMFRESKSASKSPSPENAGKITYITSFGDEDEMPSSSKPTYADKVKYGLKLRKLRDNSSERRTVYVETTKKRSTSKELERNYKSRNVCRNTRSRSPKLRNKRSRSENRYRRSRSKDRLRKYRSKRSSTSLSSSNSSVRPKQRSRSRSGSVLSKVKHRSRSKSRSRKEPDNYRGQFSSYSRSRSPKYQPKSKSRSLSKSTNRKSRSTSRSKSKTNVRSKSRSSLSTSKSRSRSRSEKSGSISSKSSIKSSRSKSRSLSKKKDSPPKILPRYYGRKRSDQSSSELDESNDEKNIKPESPVAVTQSKSSGNNSGSSTKKSGLSMSLQERLKRKRQALLNKQFKADKIAEQLKTEREKQEQQHREDELREMAIKLRRRQRERRHAYDSNSSETSDSENRTRSPTALSDTRRSRSASPRVRREDREYKPRETKYKYREESRDRTDSREKESRRSPKSRYETEKRIVYRDEADRDRGSRRREEYKKDYNKEPRRDDYRSKDRSSRSLVDY